MFFYRKRSRGGTEVYAISGTKVAPSSGDKVAPSSGAKVSSTSGAKVSSTSGTQVSPTSGAKVSPTSGTQVSPTSGAKVSSTSGTMDSPTSGTQVSPTSGAKVSSTRGTQVSPTSGTQVSPTSGAKVSPTSGTKVSSTSGTHVSPTSGAKVSSTSPGSSGMGARRPNFRKEDMNAIHRAASKNKMMKMLLLLNFEFSDVYERDKKGRTALHVACAYGHASMVKLLINRPLLNLLDNEKKTALIHAVQYQNMECAALLLKHGANPNIKDNDGNTALHYAVLGHNKDIAEKLLSCKANIEVRNKSDLTPLALAKLANNEKMVELLVSRGAKDDQSKQQLTSEEKGPQKSESHTPVTDQQETRRQAWTETKSMTVVDISDEDSLSSHQKITSEYKEEKRPQKFESHTPVTELRKTQKEAWTKTKSMTVIEVSEEDSLSSKQQLTSEYKKEKEPKKSESCTPVIELQETQKEAWTKTKSMTVTDVSEEDSLSSKQPLTSTGKYKEKRGPQKSEGCTPDLRKTQKHARTETKSRTVVDTSEEDSFSSKQQLTSKYKEKRRTQKRRPQKRSTLDLQKTQKQARTETKSRTVIHVSEEDSLNRLCSKPGIDDVSKPTSHNEDVKVEEEKKKQGSSKRKVSGNMYNAAADDSDGWSQKSTGEHTHKQQLPVMKSGDSDRICSKPGIDDDSKPTSYNEDLKEKVISETHTGIAKTSKNQSKRIHPSPLHLKKTTQESQIKRASDKEDTSAYSGHPSVQKDEEMCIKQGTLEQRKNLQLFKDESKQKPHEFSVKLKMTECPEEEPPRDNSKGGASLRQMPSNLTSKMLDCEGKDAFGMSVSAALQTFPGRKVPTFKIVPPSHADPGSAEDSSWSSSSELSLKEKELHSENDHKPDAEHILNKNEESFYNDIESKNVRTPAVTSEVREDQEFAMQMTKNMNRNTTERKLGIGPTPQSSDPKSHLDLWLVGFNETKQMIERKSHDMSAVTNTYQETKPNQHLFQKPLGADHCSANYFQSVDSRVKDESSSALHNDRTPGAHVTEELQQDLQRRTNDIDMVKVERPAWKKEIVHLQKEVEEEKKKQGSSKRKVSGNMYNAAADDSDEWSQKSTGERTHKQQLPVMKSGDSDRICSKPGIDDDSKPTSYNEDLKEKVISETHTGIAKTSKNQSKRIHPSPLHLKKTTQESQIKRASDKEDTSAYSGHPSVQKDEEMCIKQGTLEQRKNLQLFKDESKQKPHEFSVKLKMTECPEEEPPRDNSKGGASLRQMPSNLTSKMLDCEGKDAFGMSVSAALQTFPGRKVPTFKIVPPSHADPGSAEDSSWSSSSELSLKEKELHSENDHKPDAEHILNKNEESFYNDIESKNVRTPAVTSEVREDQEFAMQMTKNMNRNTTERKLGIGPTPQSSDPKSHLDLWLVGFNETKQMIERKSHDMSAVTNTYQETKPNQHLFQKPLGADHCSANYFQSVDSRVKDESSSALHNDRTPGAHVTEELQQDLQRRTNDIDMVKVERPAWKKEIVHLQKEVEEEKKKQGSSKRKVSGNMYNAAADDSDEWSQKSTGERTHKQQLPVMKSGDSDRICSKPGIDDDSKPTSYNEDLKEKVISETHTGIAKTSKNQSKRIHPSPLHLKKTTQESQIKRASDKEDTSAYSGHPSVQKDEEMCIKQGTLEQRKNLQLFKDESKQKPHEFSVKLKMTECPEEEPPRDNSKGGASLRQMPSNLTSKMLDCEGKDAFGMSVSAALQTFPGRKVPTFKIVPPSHADPGSAEDSSWSSSSELSLKEKELHSENDHKPDAEHILNKNEESFYNDIESKNVRTPAVTSEVREDQEFAMQMTKNMNRNTTERKLGIGPTPQSSDPKSHLDLWLVGFNETKQMIERKSHDMSAVTNTYQETKPNQHLFQKPLGADHCSANYFQSVDSRVKDESSSALHNDRTPGAHVTEELQQDLQRRTNDIDMVKVERPAWKKEIVHLQKEVEEEKKKQGSSKRKVSGNMYNAAADDSDEWSQKSTGERTHKQQLPVMKSGDSDRFPLREEKEKRLKADLLCEKNRVQLRKKEEHSIKEVEMNPQLETTIRTQYITLEIIRENEVIEERNYTKRQPSSEQTTRILQDGILTKHFCKPKVSESSDKEKSLLHENRMLWDEIAKLRLEIDAVKIQTQEMGKKYIEDIAIVKEKNDCLEKTIRKTVFQHNAQLDVLKAELIMLNCKLENEQQNRGRLEAEVESYQSRLATAVQDHEHCQTSKRDLQLAFQRARDEWFCVWHKMNFDMSILKQNNEILSQQLSKAESKINNLEIELHHIRDALKERTLVLERELSQKQCQKEETEHVYQEEQGKVDEDIGKQESLQEKLSHLQSENKLLRQKLDQAHNKADREENTAINIQDQIQDKISIFNADSVKQMLKLKESISELINEWHHFNERIQQYENDNVEIDATARQFQQELADTKKKLSTIEVFLEIESRHHMHLEDKKQDFKSKPGQSRSQNDELITKLQPASSKCVPLDEEKTPQQELSVEALLKRREELKAKIEKWKRRAVKLETDMKMHMAEGCVGEKYKLKIEEATKGLADKVAQLNLFLQTQRASQETSEQLKCMHSASIRSHLELGNPL